MKEAFIAILGFPWQVQGLILSPLLAMVTIWLTRPNLKDPADHFYYTFTSKLDRDLRNAFWKNRGRGDVRTWRENILQQAHDNLRSVTGGSQYISTMPRAHRAAWAYLWKRTHEVLR